MPWILAKCLFAPPRVMSSSVWTSNTTTITWVPLLVAKFEWLQGKVIYRPPNGVISEIQIFVQTRFTTQSKVEDSASKIPTQKAQSPIHSHIAFPVNISPANRTDHCRPFPSFNIQKAKGKEEMIELDTEPLRSSKVFGYTDGAKSHQRRRRSSGEPGTPPSPPRRTQSFSQDFGHAAAETYLVTRLSFTLLRYLGYYAFFKKT